MNNKITIIENRKQYSSMSYDLIFKTQITTEKHPVSLTHAGDNVYLMIKTG